MNQMNQMNQNVNYGGKHDNKTGVTKNFNNGTTYTLKKIVMFMFVKSYPPHTQGGLVKRYNNYKPLT